MRTILAFLFLATFSVVAQAQQVQRIEIIEAGIYVGKEIGQTNLPNTAARTHTEMSKMKLVQRTTTIPAKLGTIFDFRYRVIGEPRGASAKLRFVTRYPSPGIKDPATGNPSMRDEYSSEKELGGEYFAGYTLEDNRELLPGTWTFEIWQNDRKLAEQSFTAVKP